MPSCQHVFSVDMLPLHKRQGPIRGSLLQVSEAMSILLHIMIHVDWDEMLCLRRHGDGDVQDGCTGGRSGLSVPTSKRGASDVFQDGNSN